MQRTFVAITLALTLSCAFAIFTPTSYVKNPVVVVQNNETNYTNASAVPPFELASVNSGELDLIANNYTGNTQKNDSNNAWGLIYRKLDSKVLTSTANSTPVSFNASKQVGYANGYAVSFSVDTDAGTNNIPQITVYQFPVTGGAGIARLTVSTNNNGNFTPVNLGVAQTSNSKTLYVFYLVNNTGNSSLPPTQINFTSFTIGTTTKGTEYNLTTAYNSTQAASPLSLAWGEALGSNQLYANWQEGNFLKYGTIDVSKGTVSNSNNTGAWVQDSYQCQAYATDKKWFGDLCYVVNSSNTAAQTVSYYVRTNSTNLAPLANSSNLAYPNNTLYEVYPYGPYIALLFKDSTTTAGQTTYSYDIYNLDTLVVTKARTAFLTTDQSTSFFRVVSGGLYSLTYTQNPKPAANDTNATYILYSNITVGQVLSGSYLTSVLGFIMTIVAGVLLF